MKNGEYTGITDSAFVTVYDQAVDGGPLSRGLAFEAVDGDMHVRLTPLHTTHQAETYAASPLRGAILVRAGEVEPFYAGANPVTKIEVRAAPSNTGSIIVKALAN